MKKKVTEQSDHYGYEDMNAQPIIDSVSVYRKKSNKRNEDSDYYGYSDTNANIDANGTGITPFMGITFRKRGKNKAKIVRKNKCKCKK